MSFETERIAVQSKLETIFGAANPSVEFAWEALAFTRPGPDVSWVALLLITDGRAEQVTLGPNKTVRRISLMQFNIHTPINQGTKLGEQYAQQIADIFENPFSCGPDGAIYPRPSYNKSVGTRDGKYINILTVPYHYDQIRQGV